MTKREKGKVSEETSHQESLIVLYTNNFHTNDTYKCDIEYDLVRNFYVSILKELKDKEIKIANHYGNSLILRSNSYDVENVLKVIDNLISICYKFNFRLGLHIIGKEPTTAKRLNDDIYGSVKDSLSDEEIKKIWPKLSKLNSVDERTENKSFNFFDDSELFDKEIYHAQFLAELFKEPRFIMSLDAFNYLKKGLGIKNRKVNDIIDIINEHLKKGRISNPFPFYNKNTDSFDYAFIVFEKNGHDIEECFYEDWRNAKKEVEKLYLAYLPFDRGDTEDAKINKRKKIIKKLHNSKIGKSFFDNVDYFYFDTIFSVMGYVSIDFNKVLPEPYALSVKDYLSQNVPNDITKKLVKWIFKENKKLWDSERTRKPYFFLMGSFPALEDELYFRKQINSAIENEIYFRTEDIFDGLEIRSEFITHYCQITTNKYLVENKEVQKDIIINRLNNNIEYQLNNNNDDFSNNNLIKLLNENENIPLNNPIFIDDDWYILVIFSLETEFLNQEDKKSYFFEHLIKEGNLSKNIKLASNNVFSICSFGILRGTWDGYFICHINNSENQCYGSIIENIFKQTTKQDSFFNKVVYSCEVYFLRSLIKDNWSKNLLLASLNEEEEKEES